MILGASVEWTGSDESFFQTLNMLNIYTMGSIVIQKINITSYVIKYFYYFRSVSFKV